MFDKRELIEGLQLAYSELHEEHGDLLDNDVREDVMAFHFNRSLYDELDISGRSISDRRIHLDIEYDKNIEEDKNFDFRENIFPRLIDELPSFGLSRDIDIDDVKNDVNEDMRPDLVIHRRGSHERNNFVGEIKKSSANMEQKDALKVLYLTHPATSYCYDFGAVIPLIPSSDDDGMYWVEEGSFVERIQLH